MALDFNKTSKMANDVIKKVDDTDMDNKKRDIPLDQIDLNPDNEHIFGYSDIEFLADEINDSGFHGAIEVYAKPDGRYEIMAGHRRYLACKNNGFKAIPCIVSEYKDPTVIAEQLIMSNIHQRDLSPLRLARAIQYYEKNVLKKKKVDYQGKKRTTLANKFNMSEARVQRHQAILKLIPELQELCDDKSFPFSYYTAPIGVSKRTISSEPAEVQKKVYDSLLAIAPEGNISELSKRMIEMQYESVLEKERRSLELKNKELITQPEESEDSKDSINVNTSDSCAVEDDLHRLEDGELADLEEIGKIQQDGYYELDELESEGEQEQIVVDEKLLFYINKINETITPDAKYADKSNVIEQMKRVLDRLEQ